MCSIHVLNGILFLETFFKCFKQVSGFIQFQPFVTFKFTCFMPFLSFIIFICFIIGANIKIPLDYAVLYCFFAIITMY